VGVFLGAMIAAFIILTKPKHLTDQEYDAWLNRQARRGLLRALHKVGMDWLARDEIDRILCIRGFVLPSTKFAQPYRKQDILWKRGQDGIKRYSINIYTYFLPIENQLVVFTFDINAVNHRDHREQIHEYFLVDIVAVTTEEDQDMIPIRGVKHVYRTQSFSLRISDGSRVSVPIRSLPLDPQRNLPTYDLADIGVEQAVAQLRMLLRSKKMVGE